MKDPIYAYVITRTDLESLNNGKAQAHAHHAGTMMVFSIQSKGKPLHKKWLKSWAKEANGAGTCIVLGGTDEAMKVAVARAQAAGLPAGVWRDPTFPSTTDRGVFLVPMDVSAWFLAPKSKLKEILGEFNLHP